MESNIKQARIRLCMTQLEVAEKANIDLRIYCYIESGKGIPNVHTAMKISNLISRL